MACMKTSQQTNKELNKIRAARVKNRMFAEGKAEIKRLKRENVSQAEMAYKKWLKLGLSKK